MYHNFFIPSYVSGHLGCFYVLAIAHSLIGLCFVVVVVVVVKLYILDINPLSYILLANVFPHWGCTLIILLIIFSSCAQVFGLTWSHLFIFAFVSLAWGNVSQKILLRLMPKSILPVFSLRIFMTSSLTVKP